jgi:hypothetical protein
MPILKKAKTKKGITKHYYQYKSPTNNNEYPKYYYDINDQINELDAWKRACNNRTAIKIKERISNQCWF